MHGSILESCMENARRQIRVTQESERRQIYCCVTDTRRVRCEWAEEGSRHMLTVSSRTPDAAGSAGALLSFLGTVYVFTTPLDFVPSPVGTPASIAGFLFLAQWLI